MLNRIRLSVQIPCHMHVPFVTCILLIFSKQKTVNIVSMWHGILAGSLVLVSIFLLCLATFEIVPSSPSSHQPPLIFSSLLSSQVDKTGAGKIGAVDAAAFLKRSGLRETTLHKIWELSDPTGKGYLDKQVRCIGWECRLESRPSRKVIKAAIKTQRHQDYKASRFLPLKALDTFGSILTCRIPIYA